MRTRAHLAILAVLGACGPAATSTKDDDPVEVHHTGVLGHTAGHSASSSGATGHTGVPPAFVPTFVAEPAGDAIAVRTNVPAAEATCAETAGAPCGDDDGDGLVDAWEAGMLERLRPSVVFDESEQSVGDPGAVLAIVARVAPVDAATVRVFLMLGYSTDYGRCGLSGHDGDSERVVLEVVRDGGVGDVVVSRVYTAAHEGTPNAHGERWAGGRLGQLSFPADPVDGQPRLQVFASDGKHATYGTVAACESASFVPCVEEDCAPDGVDPAAFTVFPPAFDAGEEAQPRLTDLSAIGFPNEDAWARQDFCGGRGRGAFCSAPVREKLLDDPF